MAVVPGQAPVDQVLNVTGLPDAVPFAGIAYHNCLHPDILQGDVELFGLGNRHVVIVLAVGEHRRRVHLSRVAERRAVPQPVHDVPRRRVPAVFHGQIVVVVSHVVETDEVGDAGNRHRRLEPVRLRDQPVGQLAAVAHPFHAFPVPVDPRELLFGHVQAVQHVPGLGPVLVRENGVLELLAVPRRAAVVHHQRREPVCRVDLRLEVERRTLLAVRAAVHHHDDGILPIRLQVERFGEERFDPQRAVEAVGRERRHRGHRMTGQERPGHRRHRFRRPVALHVHLGRRRGRRQRVGQRPVAGHRVVADPPALGHGAHRRAAGHRNTVEVDVAAHLDRRVDRPAVRRPRRLILAPVDIAADLVPVAPVGVDQPDVRILHRRLRRGERPPRAEVGDRAAVGRPRRVVLRVACPRQLRDVSVGDVHREDVVVEDAVLVGFVVGDEDDPRPVGRPVQRVLVVIPARELPHLPRRHVDDEEVQAAVVVEVRQSLRRRWLVVIPGDHLRIARGVRRFGTGHGRHEGDRLAVGRPGQALAPAGQRRVRPLRRCEEGRSRAVRADNHQARLVPLAAVIGEPRPVGRPARVAARRRGIARADGVSGGEVHDPQLAVRPSGPVVVRHRVRQMRAVGRDPGGAGRLHGRQIGAPESGGLGVQPGGGRGDEQDRDGASGASACEDVTHGVLSPCSGRGPATGGCTAARGAAASDRLFLPGTPDHDPAAIDRCSRVTGLRRTISSIRSTMSHHSPRSVASSSAGALAFGRAQAAPTSVTALRR